MISQKANTLRSNLPVSSCASMYTMNVPNETPTTSQMICRFVSHIRLAPCSLCFVLRARTLSRSFRTDGIQVPKIKVQSTKNKLKRYQAQTSKFDSHSRQCARLPFDLGSDLADADRAQSLIKTRGIWIGRKFERRQFQFLRAVSCV